MPTPSASDYPRSDETLVSTAQRLRLGALLAGIALLAYGIRADDETIRLAAIVVLAGGFLLRFIAEPRRNGPKEP